MYDAEFVEDRALAGSTKPPAPDEGTETGGTMETSQDLPIEPQLDAGAVVPEPDQVRDALLRFHLYGRRPDTFAPVDGHDPVPAMFQPYRNLERVRYDYPLYVNGSDSEHAFRPLASLIDAALEEAVPEGDAREQLRRDLYRVEAFVKLAVDQEGDRDFSRLWDDAVERVLASDKIDDARKPDLRENLDRAREALSTTGRLVACNHDTAGLLFHTLAESAWHLKAEAVHDRLDSLVVRLRDVLAADESRSESARSPKRLEASMADGGLDFKALSSIVGSSATGSTMPDNRRTRIRNALDTIERMRSVFGLKSEERGAPPFDTKRVATSTAEALDEQRARTNAMVAFLKAVRIAELEVDNRYRDAVHDEFFAAFDTSHLTEDEFALCPPVLVRISPGSLTNAEAGALLEMLGSSVPVKALVEVDDLTGGPSGPGPSVRVISSRLGRAAMGLGDVFVAQAPVSRVTWLQSSFMNGFEYAGPALFVVFTGREDNHGLDTYLVAEAAAESRLLPIFAFDPGRGDTLADRMDISPNSNVDADWPVETLDHRTADGAEATVNITFTPADFLACDDRFDDQFWHVDRAHWHDDMVPFGTYIDTSSGSDTAIPYILTVDKDGRLGRAVVTRSVLATALNVRASWRNLQENGGINNSFATRLLGEEREKLAADKEREVEAIEKDYASQLDQDIGELTKEIVHRIVGHLLTDEGLSGPPAAATAPRPKVTAQAPAPATAGESKPAPVEAEEEPEEEMVFDDPYIDTPLCTSCNECTQLNGQIFAYNENKQAYIKDASGGPFSDLVRAAEVCPVHIIHPGKPKNPNEPGIDDLIQRAARFN